MGGFGSGRRRGHTKAQTVEDCLQLDASRWTRKGILRAGVHWAGRWRWPYDSDGGFFLDYAVNTLDPDRPLVRLSYSWAWVTGGQQESADYRVRLTTTRPHLGGLRWWFVGPLVADDQVCGRRVGKLYLPPRAR